MGMYTQLIMSAEIKGGYRETDVLKYMLGEAEVVPELPNHPLFVTSRWRHMLKTQSYYFTGNTHSTMIYDTIRKAYILTIRCDLKNYNQEIEKFLDWVSDFSENEYGACVGTVRYEEDALPDLILRKNGKLVRTPIKIA